MRKPKTRKMKRTSYKTTKDFGKIFEHTVARHLEYERVLHRGLKFYKVDIIGDMQETPEAWRPSVDVLQMWHDDAGVHQLGHEVKADSYSLDGIVSTYGGRYKQHQLELQFWTERKGDELKVGTGKLFIEIRRLPSGEDGWYPLLIQSLSDNLERHIWFVLVSDCLVVDDCKNKKIEWLDAIQQKSWTNNVLLRVPVTNFIEIVERHKDKYKIVPNFEESAEGYLMPVSDLWQRPEHYDFYWVDRDGGTHRSFIQGLKSHPCTGSQARIYIDDSRIAEVFSFPQRLNVQRV